MINRILWSLYSSGKKRGLPENRLRINGVIVLSCFFAIVITAVLVAYFTYFEKSLPVPPLTGMMQKIAGGKLWGKVLALLAVAALSIVFYLIYGRKNVYRRIIQRFEDLSPEEQRREAKIGNALFTAPVMFCVIFIVYLITKGKLF